MACRACAARRLRLCEQAEHCKREGFSHYSAQLETESEPRQFWRARPAGLRAGQKNVFM